MKLVKYEGAETIIDEPTGVLLQPGIVEVQSDDHADDIVERGVAKHVKPVAPPKDPKEKDPKDPKGKGEKE